jgi:hypothetical protein
VPFLQKLSKTPRVENPVISAISERTNGEWTLSDKVQWGGPVVSAVFAELRQNSTGGKMARFFNFEGDE